MSLSKTAVSRPTTTLIIFVVLVALGFYASTDLPLALLPDMELPYVAISTSYPGAGPEEVEKRVSRPIESVVSGVSGIEQLFSDSSTGTSLVYIQFAFGTNMDEVMNDLRGYLDYVKDALPEEAKSPMIYKMDPNMIPIMHYAVSGNRTPEELRKYAEDLGPKLEQVDGVEDGRDVPDLAAVGTDRRPREAVRLEFDEPEVDRVAAVRVGAGDLVRDPRVRVVAEQVRDRVFVHRVEPSCRAARSDRSFASMSPLAERSGAGRAVPSGRASGSRFSACSRVRVTRSRTRAAATSPRNIAGVNDRRINSRLASSIRSFVASSWSSAASRFDAFAIIVDARRGVTSSSAARTSIDTPDASRSRIA